MNNRNSKALFVLNLSANLRTNEDAESKQDFVDSSVRNEAAVWALQYLATTAEGDFGNGLTEIEARAIKEVERLTKLAHRLNRAKEDSNPAERLHWLNREIEARDRRTSWEILRDLTKASYNDWLRG